jgi:hypothetical protein
MFLEDGCLNPTSEYMVHHLRSFHIVQSTVGNIMSLVQIPFGTMMGSMVRFPSNVFHSGLPSTQVSFAGA